MWTDHRRVRVIRQRDILGAWQLASYTVRADAGESEPLGPDPVGLILYTPDGYMSAQLMRRDRPTYDRAVTGGGTTEQMAAAASGYLAYAGRYDLDGAADVLHHHVVVSLLPNWLGNTQIRRADLDGDTLTLTADVTSRKGASSTHVLVWQRAA